jgi:hypothetical protein
MDRADSIEHLSVPEAERAAANKEDDVLALLHLGRCMECADKVIRYVEVRQNTPLEDYPPAE